MSVGEEGGSARCARGPRAIEDLLLAEVCQRIEADGADLERLGRPVRIVVPSRSLVRHVSAALVTRVGAAVVGVSIQTLHMLAYDVAARSGESFPQAEALFPIFVRQLAREEPELAGLEALEDGYAVVEAAVTDLLDAGFEAVHREPLAERVAEVVTGPLRGRADAVGRVAARVADAIAAGDAGHRSGLFRLAAQRVNASPERAIPARAVFVHGFADATGLQADLLEALVRRCGARVFLDRPADPAHPEREDPGVSFSRRFSERILGGASAPKPGASPEVDIEVCHAPGPQAEVSALAVRLRRLLDGGAVPERVGVVARDLHDYTLALRQRFDALGIPASALGEVGPAGHASRRVEHLLALLRHGERTPAERWLEAVELRAHGLGDAERADLDLALHARGAARLGDLAKLETVADGDIRLPVRQGLDASAEDESPTAPRRILRRSLFDAAIAAARALAVRLEAEPGAQPIARHRERLRAIVEDDLGWEAAAAEHRAVRDLWTDAAVEAPDFELDAADFLLYAERHLRDAGRGSLAGGGGGVQILTVMEARARTFEHLFVLGMNRDVFPRAIREDPLLPDDLRERCRDVLPDLPVKGEGRDEDRYLFAQLIAASPKITLSCSVTDDDGRPRPVSPLVERLRLAPGVAEPVSLPALHGPGALAVAAPRPAREHALLAGLHGAPAQFEALLAPALEEVWEGQGVTLPDAASTAASRIAVLREVDGPPARGLGPYFGFLGPLGDAADPRRAPLFATVAERTVGCPWQVFLGRLLRLAPPPDALDALPTADPRLVGSLVHTVLERIVARAGVAVGAPLSEVLAGPPVALAWPEARALAEVVRDAARALLREEGIALPGFERVLAARAQGCLEVARALDAGGAGAAVLGAEVVGHAMIADASGAEREVHFKADRVERADGEPRLVDFKTGKPFTTAKKAETRRRALLAGVAAGRLLQSTVYALAANQLGASRAAGRYAYLSANFDSDPEARLFDARADDEEFGTALAAAVAAVWSVWDTGAFFPRFVQAGDDREPTACGRCEVKEGCLRGDSGARVRLSGFLEAPPASLSPAEASLVQLFHLGDGSR